MTGTGGGALAAYRSWGHYHRPEARHSGAASYAEERDRQRLYNHSSSELLVPDAVVYNESLTPSRRLAGGLVGRRADSRATRPKADGPRHATCPPRLGTAAG